MWLSKLVLSGETDQEPSLQLRLAVSQCLLGHSQRRCIRSEDLPEAGGRQSQAAHQRGMPGPRPTFHLHCGGNPGSFGD